MYKRILRSNEGEQGRRGDLTRGCSGIYHSEAALCCAKKLLLERHEAMCVLLYIARFTGIRT